MLSGRNKSDWLQQGLLRPHDPTNRTPDTGGRPVKHARTPDCQKKRQPGTDRGYLGPPDYLREERLAVKAWADNAEQNGHSIGRADLFRQFRILTAHKEKTLKELQQELAKSGHELPEYEAAALKLVSGRLAAWKTYKGREKGISEAAHTDWAQRAPD